MAGKWVDRLRKLLIAAFFISLPITSFPYFPPSIGGNTAVVRPLLVYPLFVLVFFLTLPRLFQSKLPQLILILLVFFVWSLIASVLPLLRGTESPWREVSVLSREIRTVITLGLALTIYLTVALIPENRSDLKFSIRWIYFGLMMTLFWGTLQAIYIIDVVPGWYEWMDKLQGYISIHSLRPDRISGMTYEPSWFADQIVVLWLPLVLGASLTDYSVFKVRWRWLTVEKVLFVWTFAILAFTLSRTGLVLGIGLITFGILLRLLRSAVFGEPKKTKKPVPEGRGIRKVLRFFNRREWFIVVGILIFLLLFFIIGGRSKYISRIWNYWTESRTLDLRKYLDYIGFGARITYWETAVNIFKKHAIFGVGLGNYTIYYPDFIPDQHLAKIPELLRHLVPETGRTRVLTAKQFLLRILAETGLVGIGIFLTFIVVLFLGGAALWLSKDKAKHFWGTASLLGMVAFLLDTFSFDSFSIPNPWVMFGLVTAAIHTFSSGSSLEEDTS